jgi:hypothetical protein
MIADPATKLLNMVLPQDWQQLTPSQGLAHILDRLGVPNAQTASQQVLEGAMSGMGTGGAVAGVGKILSPIAQGVVKKYLDIIGGNVGNQMLSGLTGGATGTGAYNGALAAGATPEQAQLAGIGGGIIGAGAVPSGAARHLADMADASATLESIAKTGKAVKAPKSLGFDPIELRSRYPNTVDPVWTTFKDTGKQGWSKAMSPEAEAVSKFVSKVNKEIAAGDYQPFMDETKRTYVDPSQFPQRVRVEDVTMPKTSAAYEKYQQIYSDPGMVERLQNAYDIAAPSPASHNFYAMQQWLDKYNEIYGPEVGPKVFADEFAKAMAGTTNGQNPTANFRTAGYGNFLRNMGQRVPEEGNQVPWPIGGDQIGSNLVRYNKLMHDGDTLDPKTDPKQYSFDGNFLGYRDNPTMDNQMSHLMIPGTTGPLNYGFASKVARSVADANGEIPDNAQSVIWAGGKWLKDLDKAQRQGNEKAIQQLYYLRDNGLIGKPMIRDINESIYRGSRVYNMPQEAVAHGYITKTLPVLGAVAVPGAFTLSQLGGGSQDDPNVGNAY